MLIRVAKCTIYINTLYMHACAHPIAFNNNNSINCILPYKTVLQVHRLWLRQRSCCWLVAPWWQTWEHLAHLISALHSCMPVPPMRGHLPCRDTFAWIQKCPLKAGTTVYGMILPATKYFATVTTYITK